MFTHRKTTTLETAPLLVGAMALGAGLALAVMKSLHTMKRALRARWRRERTPRLSQEDYEAIARMEGEGGPPRPLPSHPVPRVVTGQA